MSLRLTAHSAGVGQPIHESDDVTYYEPSSTPDVLSEQRLKDWVKACADAT